MKEKVSKNLRILDKLIAGCAPEEEQQWIESLLANERNHYVPLQHHKDVQDVMWKICRGIQEKALLELCYRRQGEERAAGKRYIEPVTILFSEYYFYLLGCLLEWSEDEKLPKRKHNYPAVFRLDRIDDCRILNHKFYEKDYGNRFQGGEFRKRVQFMYPGELMLIGLRYTGKSVEAVLDRLPTAEIEREENGVYDIKAEVFGTGILMWLMSQGNDIEVLRPASLRWQMRERLEKTLELYSEV